MKTMWTYYARNMLIFHLMLLLAVSAIGCDSGFTHAQRDDSLTQAFSSHRFPEGYRYYFQGRENLPYAIMGLVQGYTPGDQHIKPVTRDKQPLKSLVSAMYESPSARPSGAYILDQQGLRVGVWYSSARMVSFKVNPETRMVSVMSDEPWRREP